MGEKRYYWLKLHDDFFTSKRIKKLRSLAGGDTYTIIYLKMQLKALKTDGYLYFDEVSDDFASELALDIDENPDDVRVTIQYLISVGLMECSENGTEYCLTFMKNLIGSENAGTQRVRDHRARQKALQCNADVTEMKRLGNAEIEIEKDIEIEIEKEKDKEKKEKTTRHKHGDYHNVLLTDMEYGRLIADFGELKIKEYIQKVDEYCQQYGKRYSDYNLTIRKWLRNDKQTPVQKKTAEKPKEEKTLEEPELTDDEWIAAMEAQYGKQE